MQQCPLGTLIGGYTIGDWYDLDTFSGIRFSRRSACAASFTLTPTLEAAHAVGRGATREKEFQGGASHRHREGTDPDSFILVFRRHLA